MTAFIIFSSGPVFHPRVKWLQIKKNCIRTSKCPRVRSNCVLLLFFRGGGKPSLNEEVSQRGTSIDTFTTSVLPLRLGSRSCNFAVYCSPSFFADRGSELRLTKKHFSEKSKAFAVIIPVMPACDSTRHSGGTSFFSALNAVYKTIRMYCVLRQTSPYATTLKFLCCTSRRANRGLDHTPSCPRYRQQYHGVSRKSQAGGEPFFFCPSK